MLAAALEARRNLQHMLFAYSLGRDNLGEPGLALRERAGLVDHQRVDLFQALERFGVAYEDAALSTAPGADHDRHRCCEPQGTRARDDQHRDGAHERKAHRGRRAVDRPDPECDQGDANDCGNKIGRNHIGQGLDGSARALRLGDHLHDLREQRLRTDALRAHHETPCAVDRAARDFLSRLLFHRDRLACDQGFVHARAAFQNHAVNRHLFSGAHPQAIPSLHLIERHLLIATIRANPDGGPGSELEQRADGAARAFAGAQLKHFAEQYQHCNHRRRLEVETDFSVGIAKRRRK